MNESLKLEVKIVKDANGIEYEAYVGYTANGTEVCIDKNLADLDNPKEMLQAEIKAWEASGE